MIDLKSRRGRVVRMSVIESIKTPTQTLGAKKKGLDCQENVYESCFFLICIMLIWLKLDLFTGIFSSYTAGVHMHVHSIFQTFRQSTYS